MKGQTLFFRNPIYVLGCSSIAGPKEGEGPLGKYFDKSVGDDLLGQKSYERAEVKFHASVIKYLLNKTKIPSAEIDACFAADLLDEIVGSSFTMREFDIPFMGVYNACASFAEAIISGSAMIEAGLMRRVICSTSSHFSTAERQYRFPLELGNQRTPLAQWTVTGAGAVMLDSENGKIKVDLATIGKVIDFGVKDANDMGAAMAPAAADTLRAHFKSTNRAPEYYDLILTGDLGEAGSRTLKRLMSETGYDMENNYEDCGALIFNREAQKVGQGGSGAACSSMVFAGYVFKKMLSGEYKKVLLAPTGALVSKTSSLQGESIPGICHAVSFVRINE